MPIKVYRDRKLITLNVTVGDLDLAQESAASQTLTTLRALPDVDSKKTAVGVFVADLDTTVARQLNLPADKLEGLAEKLPACVFTAALQLF